ncbi:uncharacterized protein LOC135463148 [Liolophura sinensis]|uniref:uncharacterized protein LOC135463148 n=1 Tax=Liolophura sinensis TaxID=3198878 RepID=UPI0031582578
MRLLFGGGIIISLLFWVPNASGHNSSSCDQWHHVAANSTQSVRGLNMTCVRNRTCTGITCTGIYHYKIPAVAARNVDFCFGFRLNPCDSPVTADIYLQVPEKPVSYVVRTHNSQNIQVPNLSYRLITDFVTADVFLDVTMGTPAHNRVEFGVDLTVRADYTLAETWPEGLKRSLVPLQQLLLDCDHPTSPPQQTPALTVGQCIPPGQSTTPKPMVTTRHPHAEAAKPGHSTPPVTSTTTLPQPLITGSGVKCNSEMISSCPPNEMCKGNICVCLPDYAVESGACKQYSTTAATTKPSPTRQKSSNSKSVLTYSHFIHV